jgi:hypothetical protein
MADIKKVDDDNKNDDADEKEIEDEKEREKKNDEWLSKFDLYQTVSDLRLSDREYRDGKDDDNLTDRVQQTAQALLKKKKDEQYDERMTLIMLNSDYPVAALRGQKGVIANAKIPKGECIGIYEGSLARCARNFNKLQQIYCMTLISDHPLPDDPAWEDNEGVVGVMYHLDASASKNIVRFVNDPKDHPDTMPANTAFLECMTDREYPVMLMITTHDIEKNQPILVDYETSSNLF